MTTRILVVDDHPLIRHGLRQIVESSGHQVVGDVPSGREALDFLKRESCDLVTLDVSLPDCSGLDVLKQIRLQFPSVKVLMLTMHPEEQYALRALKAGAHGYLTKESAPRELITAVHRLAAGGRYISPSMGEHLASELTSKDDCEPHERLSDREFQVALLIASGKGLTAIGGHLGISVKTVSTHRTHALEKMGLTTNADLVQYAVRRGLLP